MTDELAVLRWDGKEIELPVVRGTEDECAIDISKLRAADRPHHARLRLREHGRHRVGDHVHRRRRRASSATAATTSTTLAEQEHPSFLETAWLLIYGELPTHGRARRVQPPDPQAHAAARRREALLRRLPARTRTRWRRVASVVQRARDLLPDERRPARSRARAAVDHPAAREAADDRGVLVQEVDRPAVPLPRQLARPDRELPAHDVRGAVGAVRGVARRSCTR